MTALLRASYGGHLPVVRVLANIYSVDLFQKDKVRLTQSHALVTMHIFFITHGLHAQACSNTYV